MISTLIKGLFGNWAVWALAAVIGSGLVMGRSYLNEYERRAVQIEQLETKVKLLTTDTERQTANLRLRDQAVESLNQRLIERQGSLEDACSILEAAKNSKAPGADDPVGAPVSDVLERLKQKEKQ